MHRSLRTAAFVTGAVLGVTILVAPAASAGDGSSGGSGHTILRDTLMGSMPDGPVLFGVKPGGVDWVVDEVWDEIRDEVRDEVRDLRRIGRGHRSKATLVCRSRARPSTSRDRRPCCARDRAS